MTITTTTKLLFLIALIPLLILVAPLTNVFALSTNQTTTSNMIATYLKNIDTDLKKLTAAIEHPILPPPPPLPFGAKPCMPTIQNGSSVMICPFPRPQSNSTTLPVFPQIGPCQPIFAHGINQTICAPIPPNSNSQSLNETLNSTICKEHNDNGVLITCPVFPSGLQPPIPLPPPPPPFLAWLPPDLGMGAVTDCIYTGYGVFCPTN